MTKLGILLVTTAACSLLPSVSQATCSAYGTIPRVIVTPGGATIGVRSNVPGSILYNFTTANALFANAALVAQASHEHVQVVGNATTCGTASGGQSAGGNVLQMIVSP